MTTHDTKPTEAQRKRAATFVANVCNTEIPGPGAIALRHLIPGADYPDSETGRAHADLQMLIARCESAERERDLLRSAVQEAVSHDKALKPEWRIPELLFKRLADALAATEGGTK